MGHFEASSQITPRNGFKQRPKTTLFFALFRSPFWGFSGLVCIKLRSDYDVRVWYLKVPQNTSKYLPRSTSKFIMCRPDSDSALHLDAFCSSSTRRTSASTRLSFYMSLIFNSIKLIDLNLNLKYIHQVIISYLIISLYFCHYIGHVVHIQFVTIVQFMRLDTVTKTVEIRQEKYPLPQVLL